MIVVVAVASLLPHWKVGHHVSACSLAERKIQYSSFLVLQVELTTVIVVLFVAAVQFVFSVAVVVFAAIFLLLLPLLPPSLPSSLLPCVFSVTMVTVIDYQANM